MPILRVSDEVFRALQKEAQPLVDTPESVLQRLLGLDKAARQQAKGATRLPRNEAMSQRALWRPILAALRRQGGRAKANDILKDLEAELKPRFKDVDLALLRDGYTPRWEKNAHFARFHMVRQGLLRNDSPRGVWEITDTGREFLRNSSV